MNNKISVIYCTCDKYERLWAGFFGLWCKYWPDFDASIIINTESKSFSFPGLDIKRPNVEIMGATWSERLYASLESVDTPYVLLTLDDFYIKNPVDTDTLGMCIKQLDVDPNAMLFTFGWQPGKNKACAFSDKFEERARFAPYRVNAQIALWRVSYLKRIIKLYENPWQFELNGSFRSSLYGGKLYSLKKDAPLVFDYDWGFLIVRGQLNREVADYFEQNENIRFGDSISEIDIAAYRKRGEKRNGFKLRKLRYLVEMIISLFRQ